MAEPSDIDPEQWLEEHGDYLLRYALVRVGDHSLAEDMVQETFLAGMKAGGRYDGRAPVRYWLRGILRHKIVDHIRKASREVTLDDTDDEEILDRMVYKAFGIPTANPAPWAFNPRRAFEEKEFWQVFYQCLAGLKGRLQQAFAMRELEGHSTEEICKELEVQPNNLWVILHRARQQLKNCLEKNWDRAPTDDET